MKNVYYNGSIGAYVAVINGTEYRLLALDLIAAKAEAKAMAKFMGTNA